LAQPPQPRWRPARKTDVPPACDTIAENGAASAKFLHHDNSLFLRINTDESQGKKEKKPGCARIKGTLDRAVLAEPDLNQTMRKAKTRRLSWPSVSGFNRWGQLAVENKRML